MSKLKVIGLIPSRIGSTRLPQKALLPINNLPLIIHTYRRAKLSKKLDDVIICCDDKKIFEIAKKFNAKVILTSTKHKNGTERIYEVAKKIKKIKLIIDIQGDMPLLDPTSIDKTIDFHKKNQNFDIVLPSMPMREGVGNKSIVKNIFSKKRIIYFSREKTPYNYNKRDITFYKHLSIISFKPDALKKFNKAKMGEIEKIEGIELMRALEIGLKIGTFVIKGSDFAVDVTEDLIKAMAEMPLDKIRKLYK